MAFNKSLAGYFDDVQHIGIPTDDMAKTIAFWEKLGFKKLGEFDTDDQEMKLFSCNMATSL